MSPRALWRVGFIACVLPAISAAQDSPGIWLLDDASPTPPAMPALEAHFKRLPDARAALGAGVHWLKIEYAASPGEAGAMPVVIVRATRQAAVRLYRSSNAGPGGAGAGLARAATLAGFRGTRDTLFAVPADLAPGEPLYARIELGEPEVARFSDWTLEAALRGGAEHARVIALTVGALAAMSMAALLIWFVLKDRLFVLYAALFSLQALYVAYLSGQGFEWPLLSWAAPLGSFAWNVPVGLSGAAACLFVREIADLRHSSPRVYTMFGWFAALFVLITVANLAKLIGYGPLVNLVGNVVFTALALFTLVVAFLSWRRGNRAAGWFLIAWGLLEGFTVGAAVRFLFTSSFEADPSLYYYGLPLSMVAAAVLVALGVADRLREQRAALTDAERRAQTDPLTGVLNRRSLIERLDAACVRARARGLPISILFIDLDHFKQINDTRGHQAGDACLKAIIEPIASELRQSDVIGRFGGEEFVVVLSSADGAAAHPIAQRILERVSNVTVAGFGDPFGLTCSIGVAASDILGVWGESLIAQADAAVYIAKRSGRNRVQMAIPLHALQHRDNSTGKGDSAVGAL